MTIGTAESAAQWVLIKGRIEGPWTCLHCHESVVIIQDVVSFKLHCGCMEWRLRPWTDEAIIQERAEMPG